MSDKKLLFFVLQVIFLFFMLLSLFYWVLPVYNLFLSLLVEPVLTYIYPRFFDTITAKNDVLEVVTNFAIMGQPQAQLAFDINPLKYSYGLPLFFALLLVSKGLWRDKIWSSLIAAVFLLLAQTWGLCFDIIRNLLFEFNGVYAAYFNYGTLATTLVSLGSQLGFLLFPNLVPILLWIVLMPDFFKNITRRI